MKLREKRVNYLVVDDPPQHKVYQKHDYQQSHQQLVKNPNFLGYYLGKPFFKDDETDMLIQQALKYGMTTFQYNSALAKKNYNKIMRVLRSAKEPEKKAITARLNAINNRLRKHWE